MTAKATLYVGIAAPLIEDHRYWLAAFPDSADDARRKELVETFPVNDLRAYARQEVRPSGKLVGLAFRTPAKGGIEHLKKRVEAWCGAPPKQVDSESPQIVQPIDERRYLSELRRRLDGQPVRLVHRFGLTLQQLQDDLTLLKPEMVVVSCHGTRYGELYFEDGRGLASVVSGEKLFKALQPKPRVLFLAACHSDAVLRRAQEHVPAEVAIVSVDSKTKIEVTADTQFQSMFFQSLLDGASSGNAFDAAQAFLENSEDVEGATFDFDEGAAKPKFNINADGCAIRLDMAREVDADVPLPFAEPPRLLVPRLRRGMDRFVGRRRELAQALALLLPLPTGISRAGGDRRLVTLTKEGGIGKTALAAAISEWVHERHAFPAGVYEISCEDFTIPAELLSGFLTMFGVQPDRQRGDLPGLLREAVSQALPAGSRALLLLDNLDDFAGNQAPLKVREEMRSILETLLGASPELRILATCRWPVNLAESEATIPIGPLSDEDSRDVFASHVESPVHQLEIRETWEKPDSPIRQLIFLSGRHPQSLRLLARQLSRPGMSLATLRDEAHDNLLPQLSDRYAADDERHRQYKVESTFELSYKHLSEPARELFGKLAALPGGIWCGEMPERVLNWSGLLGDRWKELVEKELDYYSLGHFEPGPNGTTFFRMLPAMLEFGRDKADPETEKDSLAKQARFWRERASGFNMLVSGKLPERLGELDDEARANLSRGGQRMGLQLFASTQANWLALFETACESDPKTAKSLLLEVVPYLELTGQRALILAMAFRATAALRSDSREELLAPVLVTLANVQSDLGEREAARDSFNEALGIYGRLVKQHPAAYEPDVAMTLNNLGTVQSVLGEREAARESFNEALGIYRRLAEQHPAAYKPDVAGTLNNLGNVQRALGEREAARDSYNGALAIYRLAKQHPAAYEPNVATTLNNLGNVQCDLGEREAARDSYNEALAIYRRLAKQHPAAYDPDVAGTLNNLGSVQRDLGEREEAAVSLSESLSIFGPLAQQVPAAYGEGFVMALRNYAGVAPETDDDHWWAQWNRFQKAADSRPPKPPPAAKLRV
jgi:tetratricopeptide (TPR) repeat protein